MPRGRRAGRATGAALLVASLGCGGPEPLPAPPAAIDHVTPLIVAQPVPVADGSVRLAAVFPAVGRFAGSGLQSRRGARLAVRDINATGVHGRRIQLLEYGTGSYFVDAGAAAELAADQARVLGIVGANSTNLSKAIAEVAEERHVVQISNVSTGRDLTWNPQTGADRPFVFRVCSSDDVTGRVLATFARAVLHAHRAAILYEVGREYSAQLARSFTLSFRDPAEGRSTGEFAYLPLETDFRSQLRRIRATDPDVLFVPGSFTDATLIAAQARRMGLQPVMLGADGWSNHRLFKRGGPPRESYYTDQCYPPPAFTARYEREFGEPSDGCRAVLAYDAVVAFAAALDALGPLTDADLGPDLAATRLRLRSALSAVRVRGQTGEIRFDGHGDVERPLPVMKVGSGPSGAEVALLRFLPPR